MNGEFLLESIGGLDDSIIEKSLKKMKRIKTERRIRICSAVAAVLLLTTVPVGIAYRQITSNNMLNYSPPPVLIDGKLYRAHIDDFASLGLPKPSDKLAGEFIGEYSNGEDNIRVYAPKTPADYLIGELDGKYFYLIGGDSYES